MTETDFCVCVNRPNTVLMFVFMEQLQRLVGVSTGQSKAVSEKKASEVMKA
jgi:dicarboxylate transporter 10